MLSLCCTQVYDSRCLWNTVLAESNIYTFMCPVVVAHHFGLFRGYIPPITCCRHTSVSLTLLHRFRAHHFHFNSKLFFLSLSLFYIASITLFPYHHSMFIRSIYCCSPLLLLLLLLLSFLFLLY